MTKLLISVRDADEANTAISAGADIIDVKEPRLGSLGAATRQTMAEVARVVAGRVPFSIACGELLGEQETAACSIGEISTRINFAKLGLAGCGSLADWPRKLQQVIRHWPTSIAPVAVIYADWRLCDAPTPEEVLLQAAALGCGAVLVDTHNKSAGNLLTHFTLEQLGLLGEKVKSQDQMFVLAGSLDQQAIESVVTLQPDFIAVRGAVCRGCREGTLDAEKVSALKSQLQALATGCGDNAIRVTA